MKVEEISGKWVGTIEREIRVGGDTEMLPRVRDKYR